MWKPGDHLSHRFNPELGAGRVAEVEGRRLVVDFPERGQRLRIAIDSEALVPLALEPGSRARHQTSGETVLIESRDGDLCRLSDGREMAASELWPLPVPQSLVERLARGRTDARADFLNRLDALRLSRLREAGGLGSFLGGRIRLFPHQLYAAERACRSDPVRWLLADEVGLGKTVEACLIMNRLLHTGRAERVLVVAPETLTVQWLGELWRKYHQVFVLLDDRRLADVRRDYGRSFNPFAAHPRAIVSLEKLAKERRLAERAAKAGLDLLVVDEAHHLERPPGQKGNAAYRAIAPIARRVRHVLLLTATPLEDDAHGFFRLLQLLRPKAFPEKVSFKKLLARRKPLPPCTSSTRRSDVGGLPPRVPMPVELDAESWKPLLELERRERVRSTRSSVRRQRKAERLARAMASSAALEPHLPASDTQGKAFVDEASDNDPRVAWLMARAREWRQAGEKTLVFVAHKETLELLRSTIGRRIRLAVFHEDLPPERRDLEVAQFRLAEGPAILVSTEAGGEGRNFEFCRRLVLFDLPWNPTVVEQRIGRLDRIGRTRPTEIVFFRPPAGLGRTLADLYLRLGLFEQPLGGLERELGRMAAQIKKVLLEAKNEVDVSVFEGVLRRARQARDRVREAAYKELHRDPYRPEMADEILDRVPDELDSLTAEVVLRAVARLGFSSEERSGKDTWLIELGSEALVDRLPGVPPGSRFLGTFDREEAVADESIDFFAFGHNLVEGVLAELEEGDRGRVALVQISGEEEVFGLLAIYKRGAELEAVVVDREGKRRPELAELLTSHALEPLRVDARKWTSQPGWEKAVRRMAAALPANEVPKALAAFRIRRRESAGAEG